MIGKILSAFLSLFIVVYSPTHADPLIRYSKQEMLLHKNQWMKAMETDPNKKKDQAYQMSRALLTISGDDADYIPKVPGAGELIQDGALTYQLMHNGVKVIARSYYDAQWLEDVIIGLKGHHEPQEEKCFYEILKYIPEGATMIELGSYWAYYSLWFATEIKGAKNYLIEPDPRRLAIGQKNFALNQKKGIFRRGYVGVMLDADPDIHGAECISMDDFIEQEQIDHVHILHADIQGGEYAMLQSIVNHLDKVDFFVISTHNYQTDHLPCLQFLRDQHFTILAAHGDFESCSGDGLIVAKRKGVAGPDQIPINTYKRK